MEEIEIATVAKTLVLLCIELSLKLPRWALDEYPVRPWLTLSVANLYLSFTKHWFAFLFAPDLKDWKAVNKQIDDIFFHFVNTTNVEIRLSDVILLQNERDFYRQLVKDAYGYEVDFQKEITGTSHVLTLLYAHRCNQYTEDLKAGFIYMLDGHKEILFCPIIFACKRFAQYVYGIDCDARTIDKDERFSTMTILESVFFDAYMATQTCCANLMKEL